MDFLKLNENLCLICLEDNATINWNEEIAEFSNMSYKDCYYKYTSLQPRTSEYFPSSFCEMCSNGLKNSHIFFEKALESFKFLQDALKTKEGFDMEVNRNQKTTNFENNDKTIDIGEEIMCPTNAYDNESVVGLKTKYADHWYMPNLGALTLHREHAINKSITEEVPMNEDESNELTDISELSTEMLLDKELSQSSDTKNTVSSTTASVQKMKYLCAFCSLIVSDKYNLKAHEATHSENRKRTEICPQCGIKLYTKKSLRNHMETHAENRQKKFKCDYCDKAFYNRGALNVHRRIHLGQMVSCRICSKEFYRQVDLDRHLLGHSAAPLQNQSGQSKYTVQCQYCNKTVASRKWREHKAAHIGEPQVKCKICDKKFFARIKCVMHLNRYHRKTKDEYEEFIHYFVDCKARTSHLMITQQEIVHPVTK